MKTREETENPKGAINPENGRLQGSGEKLERQWRYCEDIDEDEQ